MATILEELNEGVVVVDNQLRVIFANEAHGGTSNATICPVSPSESPTAITHGSCAFLVLSSVWQSHGNH
jgi:hypothetical protein